MTGHRFPRRIHQHETAGAIGILCHAALQADLSEGGRLLIARHAGDRDTRTKQPLRRFAIDLAVRADLRQQFTRNIQQFKQFIIPGPGMDIVQQGSAGIADVSDM